jgi:hypothetical protein
LQAESFAAPVHVLTQPALITLCTFHAAKSWLKFDAYGKFLANMELMLLTDAVFHREMSWLKLDAE